MDPQVLAEMEKLARQKAIIRHLESSGGTNLNHAVIHTGPNAGQQAGGAYGILPNSLKDFVNQSRNRKLPIDPALEAESNKEHNQVTKDLNTNREIDDKAAEMALRLINSKTGGDEEKTALAWRTGHNQSDEQLQKGVEEHPYVQAYRKEREKYLAANPDESLNRSVASDSRSDLIRNLLDKLGL